MPQQNADPVNNEAAENVIRGQEEGEGESTGIRSNRIRPAPSNSRQRRVERRAREREEARQRVAAGLPPIQRQNSQPSGSTSVQNLARVNPGGNMNNQHGPRVDRNSHNNQAATITIHEAQQLRDRLRTIERQMNLETEEEPPVTHPFTPEVMMVPLPDKFKMPQIPLYDGSTDPEDHLRRYNSHMNLYGVPGEIACRAFESTLADAASRWFGKLRPNSIGSWGELSKAFSSHFVGARSLPEPKEKLVTLFQGPHETLKDWIKRYTVEVSKTEDCTDEAALMGALSSLRGDIPFRKDLDKQPAKSFKDFLKRAKKHISAEEIRLLRDQKPKMVQGQTSSATEKTNGKRKDNSQSDQNDEQENQGGKRQKGDEADQRLSMGHY